MSAFGRVSLRGVWPPGASPFGDVRPRTCLPSGTSAFGRDAFGRTTGSLRCKTRPQTPRNPENPENHRSLRCKTRPPTPRQPDYPENPDHAHTKNTDATTLNLKNPDHAHTKNTGATAEGTPSNRPITEAEWKCMTPLKRKRWSQNKKKRHINK